MYLEIISPEKTLFKGEVESILFPGTYGDFQVLNNHAPIVSTLTKGKVKIIGKISIEEGAKDKFEYTDRETLLEIESGTVEMNNNQVTLLVD
jgi:F-type H+-transporting ATPase subunit epsilon